MHTFCVIFFHWAPPSNFLLPSLVVVGIWLYCALYVGIAWALHHDPGEEFFQPVPYWVSMVPVCASCTGSRGR